MMKPAHFFDINYLGSDVIIDNFAVRSTALSASPLGKITSYNNKYEVRSDVDIEPGSTIEECPFVVLHNLKLSKEPVEAMTQMESMFVLEDHSQYSKDNGPRLIIAGGNAPFYGHSFTPNAYLVFDHIAKVVHVKALVKIPQGHEITLYRYGSFHVMKNNEEIQKFYTERQKELQQKNVDTSGFRAMSSPEIKNIETIEVQQNT